MPNGVASNMLRQLRHGVEPEQVACDRRYENHDKLLLLLPRFVSILLQLFTRYRLFFGAVEPKE